MAFTSQSWGRSLASCLSFRPSLVTYSWGEGEASGTGSSLLGAEPLSVWQLMSPTVRNFSRMELGLQEGLNSGGGRGRESKLQLGQRKTDLRVLSSPVALLKGLELWPSVDGAVWLLEYLSSLLPRCLGLQVS